jgi:hypothetical protein
MKLSENSPGNQDISGGKQLLNSQLDSPHYSPTVTSSFNLPLSFPGVNAKLQHSEHICRSYHVQILAPYNTRPRILSQIRQTSTR